MGDKLVAKGDDFSLTQCLKINLEIEEMTKIPYASVVGSLMYAQLCTRPDIEFIVVMLSIYMSNHVFDHWKAAKRVMRYLKRTNEQKVSCSHIGEHTIYKSLGIRIPILMDVKIANDPYQVIFSCYMEE